MSPPAGADTENGEHLALAQRPGRGALLRVSTRVWQAAVIVGLWRSSRCTPASASVALAPTRFVDIVAVLRPRGARYRRDRRPGVLVPEERAAWAWLAAGLAAYSLGDLVWTIHPTSPAPTIADALYLFFYPAAYIALLLLVRSRVSRFNRSVWLDGSASRSPSARSGAAFLLELALDHSEGDPLAVATNLAYPLGDVVLLALVVGVFWLVGRNAGLEWVVIAGGLRRDRRRRRDLPLDVTTGTYEEGVAARHPVAADGHPARRRRLGAAGPCAADHSRGQAARRRRRFVCTIIALAVFVVDHFSAHQRARPRARRGHRRRRA